MHVPVENYNESEVDTPHMKNSVKKNEPTFFVVTSMSRDFQNKERLHGPDVLRGFAASGVVFFHVFYLSGMQHSFLASVLVGRFDFLVRLFFALSAFAIAYAYCGKLTTLDHWRIFYIKRFLRIAPLFYFMMLLGAILMWLKHQPLPAAYDYALSMTFLFPFIPGKHGSLVLGGWSLGIECLFYVFFPFLICLIRSLRSAAVAWSILCLVAVIGRPFFQQASNNHSLQDFGNLFFLSHLQFFIAGIACYYICQIFSTNRFLKHSGLMALCLLVSLMLMIFYFYFQLNQKVPEEVFISIILVAMIFCAVQGLPVWLDNRITRYIGRISYSIYLTQFIVIELLYSLGIYTEITLLTPFPFLNFILASLLTLTAVIGISAFTYRFIEVPGMRSLGGGGCWHQ